MGAIGPLCPPCPRLATGNWQPAPSPPRRADQNGARVEQREPRALDVLLRLRPRLRRDDGEVAPLPGGVDEPGTEQCRLNAAPPVRRQRRGSGELREAV